MRYAFFISSALTLLTACSGHTGHRAPVDERPVGSYAKATDLQLQGDDGIARQAADSARVTTMQAPAIENRLGSGRTDLDDLQPDTVAAAEANDAPGSAVNPAVVALLNAANRQVRHRNYEAAAVSLERALQIDPGEAWLWHRLGRLRLMQGQPDQAEHLAVKSNTLAHGNLRLAADNWMLIADARVRRGDDAGARAARQRALELTASVR